MEEEFSFGPEEPQGLDQFPDQVREDIDGLVWLGYLEDDFAFCGHSFVIRTLRGDEELLAGLVTKEYMDTLGQGRAWKWAVVAMSLISVDGDANFCPPIGPDVKVYARARFNFVTQWYYPVAEYINGRYAALQDRQAAAMEAMESLSNRSLHTFTPFAGFSTGQGDSAADETLNLVQEDSTPSNSDS